MTFPLRTFRPIALAALLLSACSYLPGVDSTPGPATGSEAASPSPSAAIDATGSPTVTGVTEIDADQWGGAHAMLSVMDDGTARAEFDCAIGSIPGPLMIDGDGSFEWAGELQTEVGPTSPPMEATYRGRVEGRTMTLEVEVPELDTTQGPFTLEAGAEGLLRKCQ